MNEFIIYLALSNIALSNIAFISDRKLVAKQFLSKRGVYAYECFCDFVRNSGCGLGVC